jgi:hypothetical protein
LKNQITNLEIDEVYWFKHKKREGVIFSWSANIGFGELKIYKATEDKDNKWQVDSECMCSNEDKEFIRMVLNKWVDEMVIDN